jgi:hypothetical protein
MTPIEQEVLAGLLGATDGANEPQELTDKPWQADQQARRAFRETGGLLPFQNSGTATERKRITRALSGLLAQGLALVADGGRRVALTPEGDATARKLCRLPSLADSMPLLDFITDPANDAARWIQGYEDGAPILSRWLSESSLVGGPAYHPGVVGKEWVSVALASIVLVHAAPLLSAGLIEWRTVARMGGVYLYAATDAGLEIARDHIREGTERPDAWLPLLRTFKKQIPPEAFSIAWQEAFNARQRAKPANPNAVGFLSLLDAPKVEADHVQL